MATSVGLGRPTHGHVPVEGCSGSPDCALDDLRRHLDETTAEAGRSCLSRIRSLDLDATDDLTQTLGCRDQGPCAIRAILDQVSGETGLPASLTYTVIWTESRWKHWDKSGSVIQGVYRTAARRLEKSQAFGLAQVNVEFWSAPHREAILTGAQPKLKAPIDWERVKEDPMYNARVGSAILSRCHGIAKRRNYIGLPLQQATYACYHGGAINRPFSGTNHSYTETDEFFVTHATEKPWLDRLRTNCQDDAPCTVVPLLDQIATEVGVPTRVLYATAWTESDWRHWKNGQPLLNARRDKVGIMQIDRRQHGKRTDWVRISNEIEYNVRFGATQLAKCYERARERGYTDEARAQSAYACYFGGERKLDRPFEGPPRRVDRNFLTRYRDSPWEKFLRKCDP